MNKEKELDIIAKRFFGTSNVEVIKGQKADAQKQQKIQERFLLDEARNFGDILVRYIIAHRKLSKEQRAWGFGLALFCLREDYPHGIDDFDELIDEGGASLTLNEQNIITDEKHIAKVKEELLPFADTKQHQAAVFAENVSKYIETKKHQLGLSNPQAVYGMGRAFHNLRLGYPLKEGGTAAFDELMSRANGYFRKFR